MLIPAAALTAGTGFLAGGLHVVTGPDHLVALAPIAVEDRGHAMRLGALWGLGHGVGVGVVGGLGVTAASWFKVDALGAYAEEAVGVLLIGVGLWALWRSRRMTIHGHDHGHCDSGEGGELVAGEDHGHTHSHGGQGHLHVHSPGAGHGLGEGHHLHHHAAVGVGLFHGAAGTGHVFGVLPALALPPSQSVVYLVAYLGGAVLSMSGLGYLLGALAGRLQGPGLLRLMAGSGVLAITLGLVWLFLA